MGFRGAGRRHVGPPAQSWQTGGRPPSCVPDSGKSPAPRGGGLVAVSIGQPGPEPEALARGHLHQQARPRRPCVLALAGQVAYNQGLRVVMRLELMRSSLRPDRSASCLCAASAPRHPRAPCAAAGPGRRRQRHALLWHGLHPGLARMDATSAFKARQAFVKHAALGGQVKHHEAHPLATRHRQACCCRVVDWAWAKRPRSRRQLAVHGRGGPACGKPCGRRHGIAAPCAQRVPIPIAAHAVVFSLTQ